MKVRYFAALAVLALAALPVSAQEAAMAPGATGSVTNLEAGFPTAIIDTTPTETGVVEVGIAGGYSTNGEVLHSTLLQANYGLMPNAQVAVAVPLIVGEGSYPGKGDLTLSGLVALVPESDMLPSMGLQLAVRTPTGRSYTAWDGTIAGAATKTFGALRAHVNAAYTTIGNNVTADKSDADGVAIGVDYALTESVVLVVDAFSNEAQVRGADRIEQIEVGCRAALSDVDIISVGVGVGIGNGNATPDFTAVVGYQRAL